MVKLRKPIVVVFVGLLGLILLASSGCSNTEAKQPAPQALPVNTQTVSLAPVPRVDEYVATVKSRRSASIQPQVDGSLTRILVKSGDHVRAGQALMTIDPLKQQATLDQQRSTEKSDVRLQHTGSRAAAPTFPGGRDQQAEPRLGGAGIREFQSRLGSFHVSKRLPATPTCLLQLDRAICWCRGRHSGAHRRLRFAANLIDHRR